MGYNPGPRRGSAKKNRACRGRASAPASATTRCPSTVGQAGPAVSPGAVGYRADL